jgi:hypothetical protein
MDASAAGAVRWGKKHGERLVYRLGGLPIAVGGLFGIDATDPAGVLRTAYATNYWQPDDLLELIDVVGAGILLPASFLAMAIWFTWKNGPVVRDRCGKSPARQMIEELRAYFSAGVLPPWYYMFELYGGHDARSFLNRFETKRGYYNLFQRLRGSTSPLSDKLKFAERCRNHQVTTVPIYAAAAGGTATVFEPGGMPSRDLFSKPICGRGGRGAERWDYDRAGIYRGPAGQELDQSEFLERLAAQSVSNSRLVQPRLVNCDELSDLNNDALSTIRIVTCLDEQDRPEVVAAAMRMAVGDNHLIDNFHAGGIATAVDIASGELGQASNMGVDARLGWLDRHPTSGARIRGRKLPRWDDTLRLAEQAHRAFGDRVVIGWDVAVTPDGPVVVEGNGAPDLDIIQRTGRTGLANSRWAELMCRHIARAA